MSARNAGRVADGKLVIEGPREVVEGVEEYWVETFRRIIVAKLTNGGYMASIDLYSLNCDKIGDIIASLSDNDVELVYARPRIKEVKGVEVSQLEVLAVKTPGRCEVVNARIMFKRKPSIAELLKLYRTLVTYFEGRDPAKEPISIPGTYKDNP